MKDPIERQAAIGVINESNSPIAEYLIGEIMALPTAQPERKLGRWIEDDDGWDGVIWRCSECDAVFALTDGTPKENEYYFCPHCGADMREDEQE